MGPLLPRLRRRPAGDNKTAIAAGQESLDLAKDAGQQVIAARAAAVLAVALLDAGEPERASERSGRLGRRALRVSFPTCGGPISSSS